MRSLQSLRTLFKDSVKGLGDMIGGTLTRKETYVNFL